MIQGVTESLLNINEKHGTKKCHLRILTTKADEHCSSIFVAVKYQRATVTVKALRLVNDRIYHFSGLYSNICIH